MQEKGDEIKETENKGYNRAFKGNSVRKHSGR